MADLVKQVAEQNNFIRLGDVKQGPLMDWILTSGLTQDEIVAIQEPFMPVVRAPAPLRPTRRRPTADRRRSAGRGRAPDQRYKQVDAMIVKNQQQEHRRSPSDRLMKNPALAWDLVNG